MCCFSIENQEMTLNSKVWKYNYFARVQFVSINRVTYVYICTRWIDFHHTDSNALVLLTVLACNTRKYIVSLSIYTFATLRATNLVEFCTSATEWMDERKIMETWKETWGKNVARRINDVFSFRENVFLFTHLVIDIKRDVFQLENINFCMIINF